jgi:hypothetical protein
LPNCGRATASISTGAALDLDGLRPSRAALPRDRLRHREVIGALAEAHPEIDYLGIEVHRSGVGRLLLQAGQRTSRTCA